MDALLRSMAYTTYGLYAVKAASVGALELVLVGTTLRNEARDPIIMGMGQEQRAEFRRIMFIRVPP